MEDFGNFDKFNSDYTLTQTKRTGKKKKGNQPWFNEDIKEKIKLRRYYNRKKRNATNQEEKEKYEALYYHFKQQAHIAIKNAMEEYEMQISSTMQQDKSTFWGQLSELRTHFFDKEDYQLFESQITTEPNNPEKSTCQEDYKQVPEVWNKTEDEIFKLDQIEAYKKKLTEQHSEASKQGLLNEQRSNTASLISQPNQSKLLEEHFWVNFVDKFLK